MRACPRLRPGSWPNSRPAFLHAATRKDLLPGMAKGLSGWQPACSLLVVIPAQAGIQAGGPGVKGWQGLADGALGCRCCVLAFPLCGNGSWKPLDSSALVPDAALPPRPGGRPSRGRLHGCRRACAGITAGQGAGFSVCRGPGGGCGRETLVKSGFHLSPPVAEAR